MGSTTAMKVPLAVCADDSVHVASATYTTRDRQHVITGTRTGQVCLWDLKDGKVTPATLSLVSNAEVTCITECWRDHHKDLPSCARDTAVLCGFADGAIAIMDPSDGRVVHLHKHVVPGRIRSIEVFGFDHFAAVAGDFSDVVILHLSTMKVHHLLRGHVAADWHVALDAFAYKASSGGDATGLIAASASSHISVYPLDWRTMTADTKGLPLNSVRSRISAVRRLCWAPRCPHVVAVAGQRTCELLHLHTLSSLGTFGFDFSSPAGCGFISFVDSTLLLAGSHTGELKCFQTAQFVGDASHGLCTISSAAKQQTPQTNQPSEPPTEMTPAFAHQLTNDDDTRVCLSASPLRAASDEPLITAASAHGAVYGIGVKDSALSSLFQAEFGDAWAQKTLTTFPFLEEGDKIATLLTLKDETESLNSMLLIGLTSGQLVVVDTAYLLWSLFDFPEKYAALIKSTPRLRLHAHQGRVRCLFHCRKALSNLFVSAGADYDLHVWDRRSMKRVHTFNQQCGEVTRIGHLHMDLSPVWRQCIFAAATDHSIVIYNLVHMSCVLRFAGHGFPVQSISWLPPEECMVVQCTNGAAYVWQLETGHLEGTASGQIARNIVASATPLDTKASAPAPAGVAVLTGRLDSGGNMVAFVQVNLEELVTRLRALGDHFNLSLLRGVVEPRDPTERRRLEHHMAPLSPSFLDPHNAPSHRTQRGRRSSSNGHDDDDDGVEGGDDGDGGDGKEGHDTTDGNGSAKAEDGETEGGRRADVFHQSSSKTPSTTATMNPSPSSGSGARTVFGRRRKSRTFKAMSGRRTSHTTTPSRLLTPDHGARELSGLDESVLEDSMRADADVLRTPEPSSPSGRGARPSPHGADGGGAGASDGGSDATMQEVAAAHKDLAILDFVMSMLLRWEDSTFDLSKLQLAGPCKHVSCGVSGSHAKPTFLLPNQPRERRWQLTPHFVTTHSFAVYVLLNAIAEIEHRGEETALWLSIVPHFLDDLHSHVAHMAPSDVRFLARFWQHRCWEFAEAARVLISNGISLLSEQDKRALLQQLEADTPRDIRHISAADIETLILQAIISDLGLATFSDVEVTTELLESIILSPAIGTSLRVLAITAITAGCQTMHIKCSERLQNVLVAIIRLAGGRDSTLSAACLHGLSVVVTKCPRAFTGALMFFVDKDDAKYSEGMLVLLRKLVLRHPESLLDQLDHIVDTVMKTLDPNKSVRSKCAKLAKRVLSDICRQYPMIARVPSTSSATPRLAVGSQDGRLAVFDLKTATIWKVVQAHEAPVSATVFDAACKHLLTYSLVEKKWKIWQLSSTLFGVLGASCKKVREGEFTSPELASITQREVFHLHIEWRDPHRAQLRTRAGRISIPLG